MADENKWKGTSYLNGAEHELAWDGKTLTSDVKTLDKNQIRTDDSLYYSLRALSCVVVPRAHSNRGRVVQGSTS